MATITIKIEGIALCYLPGDGVWRVIFPFDPDFCHKVQYIHGTPPVPLARTNRTITVTVVGGKNQSSKGNQFKKLFNLTETQDYKAHVDGIVPKPNWEQHGVMLKIPNAVMSLIKETKSRYQLKLNGQLKHDFGKLGHSMRADIELNPGGSVTIDVPREPGFPKTFHEADGDKTITIDNDCYLYQAVSDLELLYDFIIQDKKNPAKKFEIDRHPQDKHPSEPQNRKNAAEPSIIIFGKESHDPAPVTEFGLPCYGVTADPKGLPL